MPIDTNLNRSPYFDQTANTSSYYGVLFKPSPAVQTQELNELQAILRKQVELFGDSIYQTGTIISGCNFQFLNPYPYVKLNDLDVFGLPVLPSAALGLLALGATTNLSAYVVNYANGFISTDPDLNTLYLSYRNASATDSAFRAGEILTLTDASVGIWSITINNAGQGFNNTNSLVFVPVLEVNVTSGTFSAGQYVSQPTTQANLQITNVATTNTGATLLTLVPRNADLSAATTNAAAWAVVNNDAIFTVGNTAVGTVISVIGSGAAGLIQTDGAGRIVAAPITERGAAYYNLPTVTVASPNNSTGVNAVRLFTQNFYTQVQIANTAASVGNGYAFGVTQGIIYQKGLFLEVAPQSIVIDKYDVSPNAIGVGFTSVESLVDAFVDPGLLDNALGSPNYLAPGADRLKIVPGLLVGNTVANNDYFPVVAWSEGNPYKMQTLPAYSILGDEMAKRTFDASGNFVTDRFLVASRSPVNTAFEGNTFTVAVDPGSGYVGGHRVTTNRNYTLDVAKGLDTLVKNAQNYSLVYGNYARVSQVGGVFQFSTADQVNLYDTAKGFAASSSLVGTANLVPQGNLIGNAAVRMLTIESGQPGEANAIYDMYLFNISMAQGASFQKVRSIAYGSNAGIADIVVELDQGSNTTDAVLHGTNTSCLVFDAGGDGVRNVNTISYRYRTIDQTLTIANTGTIAKSIAGNPGETYPYSPVLSASDMYNIRVIPTGGNLIGAANNNGTVSVNTTSTAMVGAGTNFITDLVAGDWVWLSFGANSALRKVTSVVNTTYALMDSNSSFVDSGVAYFRAFPKNLAVPFGTRAGLSGNLNVSLNLLTLNFGMNFSGSTTVNAAMTVEINKSLTSAGAKTASRNRMVMLCTSNNTGGATGPWSLGVSDVIRLDSVYVGNSTVNTTAFTDVSSDFFIKGAQGTDFVGLASLCLKPRPGTVLTANSYILAVFDALTTSSPGMMDVVSYVTANAAQVALIDSQPVSNLGASISSYEVPMVTGLGNYWDLRTAFDFRPIGANTVTTTTNAATAPLNPANTIGFGNTANPANDKKFPVPGSTLSATVEYYLGRTDSVFMGEDGNIFVTKGKPTLNPQQRIPPVPTSPLTTLRINDITVPSYPTLPRNMSANLLSVVMTKTTTTGLSTSTLRAKRAGPVLSDNSINLDQPSGYNMEAIGSLDRRITALEYYSSLSALQTDLASQVIPSSVDPSTNRFKFGFFIDAFDSYLSSNTNDPQYAAFVSNGRLYPALFAWSSNAVNVTILPPYVTVPVVNQGGVTNTPVVNTPAQPPPPSYIGQIALLDYDYSVTHSPYVGVSNPTITSLPVAGWNGAVIGCQVTGVAPNTTFDLYWNGVLSNGLVILPGQGLLANVPVHGTSKIISDINGSAYFGAFFGSNTQTFSDILETFFQAEVDYGYSTYYLHPGDTVLEFQAKFSNVAALGSISVHALTVQQPIGSVFGTPYYGAPGPTDVSNTIPGFGWVVTGVTPTLKYNTLTLVAVGANSFSNATVVAPIWTTGKLTNYTS